MFFRLFNPFKAGVMESDFDQYYYSTSCGRPYQRDTEWLNFFGGIAEKIKLEINPSSVLDAGCAFGFLVEKMREIGIDANGVDISEYAISNVHDAIKPYCKVGSLTNPLIQNYDLIVCIEVLEHMQKDQSEISIKNLCAASDDILFSSTPFDYKETTHWNVQPPDYWSEQFAKHGFFRDINFDCSFITPWAVRYRKRNEPISRLIKEYEQAFWLLRKENLDLRSLSQDMQNQIRVSQAEIRNVQEKLEDVKTIKTQLEFENIEMIKKISNQEKQLHENEQLINQSNIKVSKIQEEMESIQKSETWRLLKMISRIRSKMLKPTKNK
jgi:SAM-dependent methyltransferase